MLARGRSKHFQSRPMIGRGFMSVAMSDTAEDPGATRCSIQTRRLRVPHSAASLAACSSATTICCRRDYLSELREISRSRIISMTASSRLEQLRPAPSPKSSTSSRRFVAGRVTRLTSGFSTRPGVSPGRKHVSWRYPIRPATRTRFCECARAGLWVWALNSPSHRTGLPDWNISTTTWEKPAALFHRAPATNRPRLA